MSTGVGNGIIEFGGGNMMVVAIFFVIKKLLHFLL
jgi:hypothetical protein